MSSVLSWECVLSHPEGQAQKSHYLFLASFIKEKKNKPTMTSSLGVELKASISIPRDS